MERTLPMPGRPEENDFARRRASRRVPVRSRTFRLVERDVDVLLALAKMRVLRTSDVAALYFRAKGTAQKRLRRLFDAGLVRAIVADLAFENRYALTSAGHAALAEALGDANVPAWRSAPRVDRRNARHLELLNRYRIALALGCARLGLELRRFVPEWDLRSGEPEASLIPDAVFVIFGESGQASFALEIDTGTEPSGTVMRKLERYDAAAAMRRSVGGSVAPSVVIVTATPRRARTLARALAARPQFQPLLGAAPFVLEDGGLTTGLASVDRLAAIDGTLTAEQFGGSLGRTLEFTGGSV